MMKRTVTGIFLLSACLLFGASVWEGSAVVAGGGELPDSGYYVSTNSFPRNTIVDVKNLETDRTVRAIVAGGLNSPGLLVALSKDAAAAIGMNARGVGRVRVTMPADPIAFSRFTEGLAENPDPDRNPKAAIAAAGAEAPKAAQAHTVSVQDISAPEIVAEVPGAGPVPAKIPSEASVAAVEVQAESSAEAVAEEEVAVVGQELPIEPQETVTPVNQSGVETTAPVTEIAEAVDDGKVQESAELAPKSGLPVQKALSTEPVDIPDDYVPPPALAGTVTEAETGTIVEAEPVEEPAPEAEPEMVADMAEPVEEPLIVEDAPLAETEALPDAETETAEETAVLEEAGSATLSVLDRLPEAGAEDAVPVPDFETPEVMDAGSLTQSYSADAVEISETAEPEMIPEAGPVVEAEVVAENPVQELPSIVQAEPDLVEPVMEKPAIKEPAAEGLGEPIPPQSEPGTVELVLEPAEERPPEANIEIAEEAFIEEPADEPQQALPLEEAIPIDSSLIVEAIPSVTAPALVQPAEPELPDTLDFVEPIPALPAAKPAMAATVPQVVVPQTLAVIPEKAVNLDRTAAKFKAPIVEKLEKGKYYVQLGAFGKADSVNGVLASLGEVFPAAIQTGGTVEKPVYRVFVGPVNLGESGALLMRFKKSGYPDAFVKEGS